MNPTFRSSALVRLLLRVILRPLFRVRVTGDAGVFVNDRTLIVANHEACYGALPALREHRVSIPDDFSVICYEDSPLARWWHPAITVIDNNARQMGELAARLLLRRLDPAEGDREEFSEFRVGTRIVERDSCRPAAGRATG